MVVRVERHGESRSRRCVQRLVATEMEAVRCTCTCLLAHVVRVHLVLHHRGAVAQRVAGEPPQQGPQLAAAEVAHGEGLDDALVDEVLERPPGLALGAAMMCVFHSSGVQRGGGQKRWQGMSALKGCVGSGLRGRGKAVAEDRVLHLVPVAGSMSLFSGECR
jgi:hypothetical protein